MPSIDTKVIALVLGFATPALAEPPSMGGQKMLIHGNYCGPGNNAPLPPVDVLDDACARHDACTPPHGLPSASCNARLQREADAIARDPRQPDGLRAMAGLIAAGAGVLESAPDLAPAHSATSMAARRGRSAR